MKPNHHAKFLTLDGKVVFEYDATPGFVLSYYPYAAFSEIARALFGGGNVVIGMGEETTEQLQPHVFRKTRRATATATRSVPIPNAECAMWGEDPSTTVELVWEGVSDYRKGGAR